MSKSQSWRSSAQPMGFSYCLVSLSCLVYITTIFPCETSSAATTAKRTATGLIGEKTQKQLPAGKLANQRNSSKTPNSGSKVSSSKSSTKNQVMQPEQFFGQAAIGYAAAKQCPEICAKLFCYCGCDHVDGHGSLLDCFTCVHGADCQICQEEAVDALRLKQEGKSLGEIQKYIDKHYAKQYFLLDLGLSPILKKYRASRLYKIDPNNDPVPQDKPEKSSGKAAANAGQVKKPGAKGCCPGKKSQSTGNLK